METNLQNPYPTDYNLLIPHDLWQAYCQISLIILLKEFTKFNANSITIIKNVKLAKSITRIATAFLNTKTLMMM